MLLDLGFQMLDLALWILGQPEVESVTARAHRAGQGRGRGLARSRFLRLGGGATLTLEVTWGLLMEKDFAY